MITTRPHLEPGVIAGPPSPVRTVLDCPSDSDAPSSSGFPGHGKNAPLELPAHLAASALSRLLDGTHEAFADTLAAVGNCVHPIRLTGSTITVDRATGEVLSSWSSDQAPLGALYRPCGNRRAEVCLSCSRVYARDTFAMIRAGVAGGKTIPTTVATNPLLFVTLTASSFGLVHGTRENNKPCRPRSSDRVETCPHGVRLSCMARHAEEDAVVGSPLCWDCYDWTSAVVWQWHAPELWRRTTIALRRALASALGVPPFGLKARRPGDVSSMSAPSATTPPRSGRRACRRGRRRGIWRNTPPRTPAAAASPNGPM